MAGAEAVRRTQKRTAAGRAPRASRTDRAEQAPARLSCADALHAMARQCLTAIKRQQAAASRGDADALHEMRVALTRLRTAIRFVAPVIETPAIRQLKREASWLNGKLGAARDLDVALRREQQPKQAGSERVRRWVAERQRRYLQVQRTLRGKRYRRFLDTLAASMDTAKSTNTADTVSGFSTDRLRQWQTTLRRKGRKLNRLGPKQRHKLRIRGKRFRYALEWSLTWATPAQARARKALLADAKTVQETLGKLNDACEHRVVAKLRGLKPLRGMDKLERPKIRKRLLASAAQALKELGRGELT
jgi:CHAD domain-containing protein